MTTKFLIEENKTNLDNAWKAKYPNGKYFVKFVYIKETCNHSRFAKRMPTDVEMTAGNVEVIIGKEQKRRTGSCAYKALVITNYWDGCYGKPEMKNGFYLLSYLSNTWGAIRAFSDKEKMREFARKYKVSEEQINCFLELDV